ncbi:MAG TPA: hypothetical protein VMJ74_02945, partial [Pseudomonadales bacterium]|nr:hypothetical protein [Pseudomonadales bacterium]
MSKLPLFVWFVRQPHSTVDKRGVLEPAVAYFRASSAAALREHLDEGMTLPDVAVIDRWDAALANALEDLPRVWLDPSAAAHDEIVSAGTDDALMTAIVTAVNLGRVRLIRDAMQSARRREIEMPREPLPDLDDFALHFQARWSIDGTSLIGVETLLRWNGLPVPTLPPEALVAAAEQRGDMRRL